MDAIKTLEQLIKQHDAIRKKPNNKISTKESKQIFIRLFKT
jgi:hypothetical protein